MLFRSEYRNFEGQIQKGFYAAGVVRIWDRGEFIPLLRKCNQKDSQLSFDIWQETLKELASGRFNFILKGKKLKGRFTLIKLKNQGSNWLFLFQSHQISIPVAKK
mgnify:FL=1